MGAHSQSLFIPCSSLTFSSDRRIVFLILQTVFLVLNASLTWALLPLGPTYLGLGFLAASTISALIAYLPLARPLYRLHYLTFIPNNPAMRTSRPPPKPPPPLPLTSPLSPSPVPPPT